MLTPVNSPAVEIAAVRFREAQGAVEQAAREGRTTVGLWQEVMGAYRSLEAAVALDIDARDSAGVEQEMRQ